MWNKNFSGNISVYRISRCIYSRTRAKLCGAQTRTQAALLSLLKRSIFRLFVSDICHTLKNRVVQTPKHILARAFSNILSRFNPANLSSHASLSGYPYFRLLSYVEVMNTSHMEIPPAVGDIFARRNTMASVKVVSVDVNEIFE